MYIYKIYKKFDTGEKSTLEYVTCTGNETLKEIQGKAEATRSRDIIMLGFIGDVATVMLGLYLYDKFHDWRWSRRYNGHHRF